MQRTAEMVVYGSFSDEFTLLGLGIQVVLGIVGVDAPMDVRDLAADMTVNFNITSLSWWGTVAVDVIALIPVIGVVKYVDELGTGMKALFKNGDELGAGVKGILKNGDEIAGGAKKSSEILDAVNDVLKRGSGKADDINRHIGELVDNAQKNLDDFKGGLEGGSDIRVKPSHAPDILAEPGGKRTVINYADPDPDNVRALTRENEAADILARQGYTVEQNPRVPGSKNPDYLIGGGFLIVIRLKTEQV